MLFLGGMRDYYDYYNVKTALPFETLSSQNIYKGKYIKGMKV